MNLPPKESTFWKKTGLCRLVLLAVLGMLLAKSRAGRQTRPFFLGRSGRPLFSNKSARRACSETNSTIEKKQREIGRRMHKKTDKRWRLHPIGWRVPTFVTDKRGEHQSTKLRKTEDPSVSQVNKLFSNGFFQQNIQM